MAGDEILRFLEAIDGELAKHAGKGERVRLYLIGRCALILRYGLNIGTKDVDIVRNDYPLEVRAIELFRQGTTNAERFGFYLEAVPQGLPPIPGGYFQRSEPIPGDWRVIEPMQPNPHDLAVTKLKRFHAKDREDLQTLCDSGDIDADKLRQALASAFMWDEKEGQDQENAVRNLGRVVQYLEGKSRTI